MTSDLIKRVFEHKGEFVDGFTKRYGVHKLVYFERYDDIRDAIHRETCLKRWKRDWKTNLIDENNLDWHDLYGGAVGII